MFENEEQLELALSEPSPALVEYFAALEGDLIVLGAGGKMGPTLARMACRASQSAGRPRSVFAVSRFSDAALPARLAAWGVRPLACDLFDPRAVAALPDVPNVVYLVGLKFGTRNSPAATWAANCYLPGVVCQKFAASRIVALSTGNVYGLASAAGRGSVETDELRPDGEYPMAAVGRERVFEFFCEDRRIPLALIRLNYATEMRYGVLVDLARQVLAEQPISLAMGYVNVIWQADANDMILRALATASTPASVWNVTGPEKLSCRRLAETLGELLDKRVRFVGGEAPSAVLSDASRAVARFGPPRKSIDELLALTADWIKHGRPTWNKPTHFEVRDGKF